MADDEDGAVKTLTFSDEIVVPASMPDFIGSSAEFVGDRQGTAPRGDGAEKSASNRVAARHRCLRRRSRPLVLVGSWFQDGPDWS
jgi:hypothetical protein